MASARKLPECDVLQQHVDAGLSNRDIAEMYGTTGEAVRQALQRCGIDRPEGQVRARTPKHFIPWTVAANHQGHSLIKQLRWYAKREQGRDLPATQARHLETWLKFMDGENSLGVPLSVHYDRHDQDGFWLEAARPGDEHYVHRPAEPAA